MSEDLIELITGKPAQPLKVRIYQLRQWLEFRRAGGRWSSRLGNAAVPWTNVLTDVTAEDLSTDHRPEFVRDNAPFFDREIRNAKARVKLCLLYTSPSPRDRQ